MYQKLEGDNCPTHGFSGSDSPAMYAKNIDDIAYISMATKGVVVNLLTIVLTHKTLFDNS